MLYYIRNNDYENIWRLCQKYGGRLHLKAFSCFCMNQDKATLQYIENILNSITTLNISPLLVLTTLAERHHFLQHSQNLHKSPPGHMFPLNRNRQNTGTSQKGRNCSQKSRDLQLKTQPQKFQPGKCDSCNCKLSLPSVHFMCKHSFHEHCLSDTQRQCQVCLEVKLEILEKKEAGDKDGKTSIPTWN